MKTAPVSEIQKDLAKYVAISAREPVILTRNGKAVAVLQGILDEEDLERVLLASNPKFRKMMDDAERRYREGRAIPSAEFWGGIEQRYAGRLAKKAGKPKRPSTKRAS